MKITLLGHSGFIVEGEKTCLIFDYFTDELGLLESVPFQAKNIVFFASHSHRDHFNKKIFRYSGSCAGFVLGSGIAKGGSGNTVVLGKGMSAEMLSVSVQAWGSTDEGVSFMTEFEGRKLFHAGDLNDWYWEEESTPAELEHDEKWFLDEIAPLNGSSPDVAFLPADGRLGRHALRGPLQFTRTMNPKLIVLMHLSGAIGLPQELRHALAKEGIKVDVAEIVCPGDHINI